MPAARGADDDQGQGYRIGAVSRLTGLTADTIRAWERRHDAVAPVRSEGGTRLYSESDVSRLQLLKALGERGEPIGAIATLSEAALRERLARHAAPRPQPQGEAPSEADLRRLAVLDPGLVEQIRANQADLVDLEVVASEVSFDAFLEALAHVKADVLVLNLDHLGDDPLVLLERCREVSGAEHAVVIYDYATRMRLVRLSDAGVRLVKAPLRISVLRRSVLDFVSLRRPAAAADVLGSIEARLPIDERQPVPERRFTDVQLARLREVRSSVDCECPNHLSGIVRSLAAFEEYSERCIDEHPDDAEMHSLLARGTGHARAILEVLLKRLCEHDGIRI
jgi:DNA-binding transcriptional MerR regulator